ncbi:hypothetical protein [Streptomyces sp. NBC_00120]|uniref:hypothetical protein n=1 Tax=Streptomyces sp. NBC_00120 TaxID=2975660 RepID=UPI00224EB863|nr:hypothetical protein [Streptomyces sp. NBC_00120]MCX5326332.1 hypothetical protein [Streptomyces sp. NBC_00120]
MDLRPRAILSRISDPGDRIDPDRTREDDDAGHPDTDAPDSSDTTPTSTDTGSGASRLPNWWEPDKPPLETDEPGGGQATAKEACEHPNPHAVYAQPTNELVAYWCADCETQLDVPEPQDGDEYDEEADEGDPVPSRIRRQWRRKGSATRIYRRPAYLDNRPAPKQSLLQWWVGMDTPTRWLLYNGTALGIGFQLGVPQFFTAETAYLVHTYGSWTDWHVFPWYGVATAIWALDHRTRSWFPLFAIAGRIPLISMAVGSLLYGSTDLVL